MKVIFDVFVVSVFFRLGFGATHSMIIIFLCVRQWTIITCVRGDANTYGKIYNWIKDEQKNWNWSKIWKETWKGAVKSAFVCKWESRIRIQFLSNQLNFFSNRQQNCLVMVYRESCRNLPTCFSLRNKQRKKGAKNTFCGLVLCNLKCLNVPPIPDKCKNKLFNENFNQCFEFDRADVRNAWHSTTTNVYYTLSNHTITFDVIIRSQYTIRFSTCTQWLWFSRFPTYMDNGHTKFN